MTDNDEFTHALAPARDMTGHPAHDKLRAYWEVPPGGLNPRHAAPRRANGNDVVANLQRAYKERSARIYEANHTRAVAAHADYKAGMTWTALQEKWGLSDTTLREHWRNDGLPYKTARRKVEQ